MRKCDLIWALKEELDLICVVSLVCFVFSMTSSRMTEKGIFF